MINYKVYLLFLERQLAFFFIVFARQDCDSLRFERRFVLENSKLFESRWVHQARHVNYMSRFCFIPVSLDFIEFSEFNPTTFLMFRFLT